MKSIPGIPFLAAILCCLTIFSCKKNNSGNNNEEWPSDSIRIVKDGLQFPWEILWGKDDHLWITERGGKISKIDPKTGNVVFSASIAEVVLNGEGGLLGMVQHPDFSSNGYLYTSYNYSASGNYREKVVRWQFTGTALSNPVTIIENIPAAGIHNGSRLWFETGASPKLFISTGDANAPSQAQSTSSLSGKILRLNPDGTVPADNPIPGNPYWSAGHRNPQGLVMANNILYASEHGPNVEDEINIIEKGRNYGWPDVNGPCNGGELLFCTANNVKEPIWSSGSATVAACGLDFYQNSRIPQWNNSLLMTTLKDATLYQFQLSPTGTTITATTRWFNGEWGRLRDVCVSPEGRVYICTSNGGNSDKIIEVAGL